MVDLKKVLLDVYKRQVLYCTTSSKKFSAMNLALSGSPGNNTVSAMSPTLASKCGVGTGDLLISISS